MMEQTSNEQLCLLAQGGDAIAQNELIENNLPFIKKTAHEIWSAEENINRAIGITKDDLVQEGSLGLLDCIDKFQSDSGNKFLTYAAPAIHNAMIDFIRRQNASFEARHLGDIERLDDLDKTEGRQRHEFIADSKNRNPEELYIAKEDWKELLTAWRKISQRERSYLWYRFGFEDDVDHPLTETARHFRLSENRAKLMEELAIDNMWLELPWWF